MFGKKQELSATAVTLECGRDIALQDMAKYKRDPNSFYNNHIHYEIRVRVEPAGEVPFESKVKVPGNEVYLMSQGVRLEVKYDPKNHGSVTYDDDAKSIRVRNPQLHESEWQAWLNQLLQQEMKRR